MKQPRQFSLLEAVVSTVVGFGVTLVTWRLVIKPVFGIGGEWSGDLAVVTIFTALSIVRGYLVRRAFDAAHNRGAQ